MLGERGIFWIQAVISMRYLARVWREVRILWGDIVLRYEHSRAATNHCNKNIIEK